MSNAANAAAPLYYRKMAGAVPELVNARFKKRAIILVLLAHFLLIICPYLAYLIDQWLHPLPPPAIEVHLVDLPLNGSPPPKGDDRRGKAGGGGKKPTTPKNKPAEPKSPAVETPKTQPSPKSVPETPKTVPAPKNTPVAPAPASKPLPSSKVVKPSDIIVSNKVVTIKTPKPSPKTAVKSQPLSVPPAPKVSADDFAKQLKEGMKGVNTVSAIPKLPPGPGAGLDPNGRGIIGSPVGVDGGTGGVTGSETDAFYTSVRKYLYDRWIQPGRAQLSGGNPKVILHVSIDSNGRILLLEIKNRSNIQAMDASVESLISTLTSLPKPPKGPMEFTIGLEVEGN